MGQRAASKGRAGGRHAQRSLGVLLGMATMTACNQPPSIVRVGEFVLADSIADYLDGSSSSTPYFMLTDNLPLEFEVVATDPEGEPVTLSAGPLPVGATFEVSSGRFRWKAEPGLDYGGGLELYIVARDASGAWDSAVVSISYAGTYEGAEESSRK